MLFSAGASSGRRGLASASGIGSPPSPSPAPAVRLRRAPGFPLPWMRNRGHPRRCEGQPRGLRRGAVPAASCRSRSRRRPPAARHPAGFTAAASCRRGRPVAFSRRGSASGRGKKVLPGGPRAGWAFGSPTEEGRLVPRHLPTGRHGWHHRGNRYAPTTGRARPDGGAAYGLGRPAGTPMPRAARPAVTWEKRRARDWNHSPRHGR